MKKLICLLLALVMVMAMAACAGKAETTETTEATEAIDPNLVLPIDKVAKYFAPVGINFFLTTTEQ